MKIIIKSDRTKLKQLLDKNARQLQDIQYRRSALSNAERRLKETLDELQRYKNRNAELEQERSNLIKEIERLNKDMNIYTQRVNPR